MEVTAEQPTAARSLAKDLIYTTISKPKGKFGFGQTFLSKFPLSSATQIERQSESSSNSEVVPKMEPESVEEIPYIEQETFQTEKSSRQVFSTDVCKLDSRTTVPIWGNSALPEDRVRLVEAYIRDLKRARDLRLFKSDEILIYSSLVNSNKTALSDELPYECTNDVDYLIDYLQSAYGQSSIEKRQSLATVKQG